VRVVDARELAAVYPGTVAQRDETVLLETGAGWIAADAARAALRRLASQLGGELRFQTRVERWTRRDSDGLVEVRVAGRAAPLFGRALAVTAGPWTQQLVPALTLHPRRAVLSWFEVLPEHLHEVASLPSVLSPCNPLLAHSNT
jgi:glycine/D-amino acid oxidase-like deaminating enzyme